ncbi:hypothetical protein DFH06DRAFT_1328308 [Mycena polygramma]|nr:hypothetical protein DFH06DRAFT_1328308 [Mycena polygramma]
MNAATASAPLAAEALANAHGGRGFQDVFRDGAAMRVWNGSETNLFCLGDLRIALLALTRFSRADGVSAATIIPMARTVGRAPLRAHARPCVSATMSALANASVSPSPSPATPSANAFALTFEPRRDSLVVHRPRSASDCAS